MRKKIHFLALFSLVHSWIYWCSRVLHLGTPMPCALALGNKSTSTLSDEVYLIRHTFGALNCVIFCKTIGIKMLV
uniref:Secreted protein n=1 Tax=Gossypium raimondii TaxID=29730 RepID=A0A0D2RL79_GOSRA|nr:hypothetical protein B456_011G123500 [Gossypium raimondii]